jgi:hypothetical protein
LHATKKLSEETSKKEFLEKGFVVSESLPSSPQPERIPVPRQKAIPEAEVKDESEQDILGDAPAKNETAENSETMHEPVTVNMMRESVIRRLKEKFGAHVATSPERGRE